MSNMDRAWAEIDLDAITHNYKLIRHTVKSSAKIMAVIKANAYGHGAKIISKMLVEQGADYLGVACVDEAIGLRKHGVSVPILIFGNTESSRAGDLIKYDLTVTVYDSKIAADLSAYAEGIGERIKIHIKIDTGMARIGFLFGYDDEADGYTVREILKISKMRGLVLEGMFTHFAVSDMSDDEFTRLQFKRFNQLTQVLEGKNITIPLKHACNSAAIFRFPDMHLDMVRAGIALYGFSPSQIIADGSDLLPAMTLKARISHIKKVGQNVSVSYGRMFVTGRPCEIATIPIGYADGYSRILSGKATVIANDTIVPVIGTICMDQCMIDVSCVNNINVGDQVILFGKSQNKTISVESIADLMQTINYEVICMIGDRVPRIYFKDKKVVDEVNYTSIM